MLKIKMVKVFSLLLICVLFISLFSTIGATTYHAFFGGNSFKQGTMIGPVDVSGLTEEGAKAALLTEVETWYEMGQISIVKEDENVVLQKRQVYSFDILKSVSSAIDGKQNPLLADIKDEEFETMINEFNQTDTQDLKSEEFKNDLLQPAVTLHPGEVVFNLAQFIKVDEGNVVAQALVSNIRDESELIKWVKEFGNINVPANTPLSLYTFLKENDVLNKFSNETLSMIATGIYSTVLPTNFDIVERHISDILPPYATFGNEAMIEKEKKDFIIYNTNPYEYRFVFSLTDKGFEVQLTGAQMPQTISISIRDEESFKPKIIKQFDSTLKKGQVVVKQKGTPGQVGKIYRIVKKQGQLDQSVLVAQDYYPPIPKIEVQSIVVPEEEQQNPTGQEQDISNPDSNQNPPTNDSEGKNGENDQSGNDTDENGNDNSDTDLWEDPDPLHLQKS
ncbi:G5 domain-containing protein [Bacillus sp. REN16]|uniref:G5 domain-containing protein n=1 Tax=Bacillus sp. REN16 TaxID=2887296 RepID=UPI001E52DD07|nr:G5 domain-containing protein [Bacillus sp. REN16]MCC3356546.1 G5 domain-containing protein [Bacillus sp. REN16]